MRGSKYLGFVTSFCTFLFKKTSYSLANHHPVGFIINTEHSSDKSAFGIEDVAMPEKPKGTEANCSGVHKLFYRITYAERQQTHISYFLGSVEREERERRGS